MFWLPVSRQYTPSSTSYNIHVLIPYPSYMIFRNELYTASSDVNDVFIHMNDCDKMCFILNDPNLFRLSAKICYTILYDRRILLYTR